MVISLEERRNTAYHEAGHVFVARNIPGTDPIHKVTIIPRGRALGITQQLPLDDRHTYAKEYLLAQIAVSNGWKGSGANFPGSHDYGGRKRYRTRHRTGSENGVRMGYERCSWSANIRTKREQILLGKEMARHRDYSESTAILIDDEIRHIVNQNFERAHSIIEENRETVSKISRSFARERNAGRCPD